MSMATLSCRATRSLAGLDKAACMQKYEVHALDFSGRGEYFAHDDTSVPLALVGSQINHHEQLFKGGSRTHRDIGSRVV